MATKAGAYDQYVSMIEEADKLADQAASEAREKAKEHLDALKELNAVYEELTGEQLPELARLNGSSAKGLRKSKKKSSGGRKRGKLKGQYAGLTVPDAITKALKGVKNGLGPADVTQKIGGNKNTVTVAMSNMAKEGTIKRIGRGLYTV